MRVFSMTEVQLNKKLLSFVIPCYNEEEVLFETLKRLNSFCEVLTDLKVEFIFIDDGSNDKTREILKKFATKDAQIKVICFARNFGHQMAVTAGIDVALGDAIVIIDADLQDPPEVVHQMIDKWKEGYDVVYGVRTDRPGESMFKLYAAHWFYRLLNKLSEAPIPLDAGDFRLISRPVVDALRAMPERNRYIRGMISWLGFRQTDLPYQRAKRFAGQTKYPLKKMLRFAADGIFSFSTKPLQISIGLGIFSASLSIVGIIYAVYLRVYTNIWVEGWTALMIAILFIGGVQLVCIGILGAYIGRIYNEIKGRPLYVVQEYVGFPENIYAGTPHNYH